MHHVVVVEAAEHVYYRVGLAYVAEELVSEAFALARAFHEAGYVDYLYRGRDNAPRVYYLGELVEPFVGHGYHADVRLYCAERKVGRLRLCAAQAVEKSGLAHVGKPYYTAL